MIELRTLGRGAVHRDGVDLPGITAQRQRFALLAYLAVEGQASRGHLLALFWPEREEERARHSLSQALYALKRELGEECLQVVGDSVQLDAGTCTVDAAQLEAAAERGDWRRVIELYKGPFLDQFSLPGVGDFEEWLANTRAALARLAHQGFRNVIAERAAAGDTATALAEAWRWTTLEPLDDEAQHTLIGLLAASGDRTAALSRFEAHRERLARELEVEPLEETLALVERVRAGESPEFRPLSETTRAPLRPAATAPELGATQAVETGASALVRELRSRRFVRAALVYLGVAWLVLQATDILVDRGLFPNWVFHLALYLLAIGLPTTLVLAWAHERRRAIGKAPWPTWAERVRPIHVALLLGLVALAPPAYVLFLRGETEPHPQIDAATLPAATRIAVLYFDDHSADGELAHIANSLTEHLTHRLAQVERLDVLPRNALKPYRDRGMPRDTIAQQLGAGMLVEGSVTGTREQLRVSVQLIDARAMTHLMSSVVDGTAAHPFALLDQVGDSIARLLRERLGEEIRLREWQAGTRSPEAWEYVQRAIRFIEEADRIPEEDTAAALTTLQMADRLLARAEAADPEWVEPIVLRGWVASKRSQVIGPGRSRDVTTLLEGLAHADRALALDTANASTLELRGNLLSALAYETDDAEQAARLEAEAEEELTKAVEIDPTLARAWSRLSLIYALRGEFQAALITAERAYEADAFLDDARVVLYRLCYTAVNLKDWDRVARWCGEGQQRYPDRETFVAAGLVALAGPEGPAPDVERAWQLQTRQVELSPQEVRAVTHAQTLMQVAAVLVRAGLADSARAVIERARAGLDEEDPWMGYYEANARLQLGDTTEALRLLGALLEAEPGAKEYIASDWWWESLHDHPRFRSLVDAPD
ncbi:MAG: BTAD domain-containing putative transcriptional regulator [Gemmatimonadales bacterium]|jgi:DNA-binding SARP family transcriptional activator/TolB-like protein